MSTVVFIPAGGCPVAVVLSRRDSYLMDHLCGFSSHKDNMVLTKKIWKGRKFIHQYFPSFSSMTLTLVRNWCTESLCHFKWHASSLPVESGLIMQSWHPNHQGIGPECLSLQTGILRMHHRIMLKGQWPVSYQIYAMGQFIVLFVYETGPRYYSYRCVSASDNRLGL